MFVSCKTVHYKPDLFLSSEEYISLYFKQVQVFEPEKMLLILAQMSDLEGGIKNLESINWKRNSKQKNQNKYSNEGRFNKTSRSVSLKVHLHVRFQGPILR